jgi:hypothetical protein
MRNLCVLGVMAVLSACATANSDQPPIAKFQNVVYRVGDQEAKLSTSAKAEEASAALGTSKPMHVYWFLSGR